MTDDICGRARDQPHDVRVTFDGVEQCDRFRFREVVHFDVGFVHNRRHAETEQARVRQVVDDGKYGSSLAEKFAHHCSIDCNAECDDIIWAVFLPRELHEQGTTRLEDPSAGGAHDYGRPRPKHGEELRHNGNRRACQ